MWILLDKNLYFQLSNTSEKLKECTENCTSLVVLEMEIYQLFEKGIPKRRCNGDNANKWQVRKTNKEL